MFATFDNFGEFTAVRILDSKRFVITKGDDFEVIKKDDLITHPFG